MLHLQVRMGDFVASGSPMLRVEGAPTASVAEAAQLITLHDERTHELDPAFGFRKLVDISIRSASDDPATTVEALHRIHEGMRQLAVRSFPSGEHRDASGTVRLTVPVRDWDDFVLLAFEEIRLRADGSPQIARRLRPPCLDLLELAPPGRRPALEDQLELLDAAVRRRFATIATRGWLSAPTPKGSARRAVPAGEERGGSSRPTSSWQSARGR